MTDAPGFKKSKRIMPCAMCIPEDDTHYFVWPRLAGQCCLIHHQVFICLNLLKEGLEGQHFVDNNAVIDSQKMDCHSWKRVLSGRRTSPRSSLEKMHWKWWRLRRKIKFLNMSAWFSDVAFIFYFFKFFS